MSLSDLNFDIGFQEIVEPVRSLRGMQGVIVTGETMYRDVYRSEWDIHWLLCIRMLWAGVVYERPAKDYSH